MYVLIRLASLRVNSKGWFEEEKVNHIHFLWNPKEENCNVCLINTQVIGVMFAINHLIA